MDTSLDDTVLERFRRRTLELAREHALTAAAVEVVSARPLTPDEAIGRPERTDFPILKGKEFMMEARFRGCRGHAFTSMPGHFQGTVKEILGRPLDTDFDRALVVATANALLAHLGLTERTAHCRDDGPRRCADGIAGYIRDRFGSPRLAIIGFQPAMIAALAPEFSVRVTDMDPDNVGQERAGVLIALAGGGLTDAADVLLEEIERRCIAWRWRLKEHVRLSKGGNSDFIPLPKRPVFRSIWVISTGDAKL